MRRRFSLLLALLVISSMVLAACGTSDTGGTGGETTVDVDCMDAQEGDTINVIYQWTGAEEEKINAVLAPFVETCGVEIVAEATRDLAVLDTRVQSDAPDVVFWPSTAPLNLYTDMILPLDTISGHQENYASFWVDLGSVDGAWLAVPVKADPKTLIWYSPAQFEAFGYDVPATFDELNSLVEQMVADGNVPWAMGFESDAATGWTGSDFIQDLLLVQQGPDYVWSLISGDTPYNDAGVVQAYETYYPWASDPAYTVGGADGTVNTNFLDAIYQVFSDPPEAMMVKQSGFAGGEVVAQYPDLEYGVDFDFFGVPGAQGLQGGADYFFAFNDTPAVQALVNFLTSEAGAIAWAQAGFDISPNNLAQGHYPDAQLEKKAELLANTSGFTPDLGDSIPAPFGDAEWQAIVEIVQGGDIQEALDNVAAAQAEALQGQ
ncbi:MAG: ABC transporter substrate-binding protein [Anaerolineales bacterium]|jgi:alpha-glucoside transport system substrate-binding protein